ncbi:MAG: hypothetical protein AB1746_06095, partial [Candidatus Zixiibacteriota bacterium]
MTGNFLRSTICLFGLLLASSASLAQDVPYPAGNDSVFTGEDTLRPPGSDFKLPTTGKKDTLRLKNFYCVSDSIRDHFLAERFNLKDDAARSFQHDAGDFLRFNPSNFTVEYQDIPLRKTVSPFNLPGNRLNVILNGRAIQPMEHLPEPDNMIDFDDVPMAPVQSIYNIEGPLGVAFGGQNGSSSLILVPQEPEGTRPESKMAADKGWNGYAYTRGMFAQRLDNGRSIRLAAGYRKSDGSYYNSDDNAYHQWGEIITPLRSNISLNLSGRLYKRQGSYRHRPAIADIYFNRFRRDRDLTAGLRIGHGEDKTSSFEFRHQRSESKIDRLSETYYRNLDIFDNSIHLSHERRLGAGGLQLNAVIAEEKYEDGSYSNKRGRGEADAAYFFGDGDISGLLYVKGEKAGDFDPAPSAMLTLTRNKEKSYFSISAGYATRFPRQYELKLTQRTGRLVIDLGSDYLEHGNPGLVPEKQMIGNCTYALGKADNDVRLSVTGGHIKDGIDWKRSESLIYSLGEYSPVNRDINFGTATLQKKIALGSLVDFSGGASYHYIEIDGDDDPPYSPDFQVFTNLELYYHIRKIDVHLYAYGEAVYSDIYTGYNGLEYGQDAVLNIKFTFRIKKFRFYYISQKAAASEFYSREDYLFYDRF